MNYEDFINKSQNLYKKIFNESIENSLEYITFVQGNFNPLRLKIELELENINTKLTECNYSKERKLLRIKRDDLKELDAILMEYIENTIEQ